MTPGEQLSAMVNRLIVPTVEQLLERWQRLYPVVRHRRPNRDRTGSPDDPTPEQDARSRNRTLAARFNGRHFGD